MASAHLREQVYGLRDLAKSNDLDSDIASLADWLRLGALTWHSLATGQHRPGRLKLEPPLQSSASTGVSADIMAGAGGAAGSAPARQWCAILHISYDTRYKHQRWWCSGQSSLALCMRSMVQSRYYAYFCKMFNTRIYAYLLTCTQKHSVYTRIYGLAAVFMCPYKYIMRYTESYLCVCWYTQYTPVNTDLYWVQLLPFVR